MYSLVAICYAEKVGDDLNSQNLFQVRSDGNVIPANLEIPANFKLQDHVSKDVLTGNVDIPTATSPQQFNLNPFVPNGPPNSGAHTGEGGQMNGGGSMAHGVFHIGMENFGEAVKANGAVLDSPGPKFQVRHPIIVGEKDKPLVYPDFGDGTSILDPKTPAPELDQKTPAPELFKPFR